mmetsp:Transcript_13063/g.36747  ORF Transcript_13063/g.36747 Transcript_13063/m.36747 type:complete len:258 (+) Transcript_13063:515-1288(+)
MPIYRQSWLQLIGYATTTATTALVGTATALVEAFPCSMPTSALSTHMCCRWVTYIAQLPPPATCVVLCPAVKAGCMHQGDDDSMPVPPTLMRAVCRHIFEVAGKRTWDFRDDYERVEADLKDFCATAPEFQDPSTTGHQTCPVLIPRDVGRIAEVIHRYAGKGEEPGDGPESVEVAIKSAAIGICYEVHEACNRYGRAPNVYGDLEKLREEYPGVKQPEPAAKPKPRDEGPQKGPPKISAEKAKTLLKKRRARSVEL